MIAIAGAQLERGENRAAGDTLYDAMSELVVIFEPARQAGLYGDIAGLQSRLGDTDGAAQSLESALDSARSASSAGGRDQALGQVAAVMAEMGLTDAALDTVAAIQEPRNRTPTLLAAAAAQAQAGDYDAARATIAAIADARYRVVGLEKLARAQARAGASGAALVTLARARTVSDGLEFSYARAFGLSLVARAQAGLDALAEARRTIERIDAQALRARALWSLAEAETRLSDAAAASRSEAQAFGASDAIVDPLDRVWLLCDIAIERDRRGDTAAGRAIFDHALTHGKALETPWLRARALSRLAVALVQIQRTGSTP